MISKIFSIMSLSLLLTNYLPSKFVNNNDDIKIEFVTEDDILNNNKNDKKIYINKNFNKREDPIFNKRFLTTQVSCDMKLAGSYDFVHNNKKYQGYIYANPNDNIDYVVNKANEIRNNIKSNMYFQSNNVEVCSSWKLVNQYKQDMVCTHNNEFFADYSQWKSIYRVDDRYKNLSYYAVVCESYIIPNTKNTDYRTDELVHKFDPNYGTKVDLLNYEPKMKTPTATLTFSVNVGAADNDGGSKNGNITVSYNTIVKSPNIKDRGNMSKHYAEIHYDYLYPYVNSGQFYEYNISQTYQASIFVIRAVKNKENIKMKNDREITIVRDGFWSNLEVTFNQHVEDIINRN